MADILKEPNKPSARQRDAILTDLGKVIVKEPPRGSLVWDRLDGFHAGLTGHDFDPELDDERQQRAYVAGYRVGYWEGRPDPKVLALARGWEPLGVDDASRFAAELIRLGGDS